MPDAREVQPVDGVPSPGPRRAAARIEPDAFRELGHTLVDRLADFMAGLPDRSVKPKQTAHDIRQWLSGAAFPEQASPAAQVLSQACDMLSEHAVSTSHPRFWAYIMGAASPMGALADFLASAISAPMTSFGTSGLTVAMEAQTIEWMARLIGYPADCGGLFVSGGSIGNLVALRLALQSALGPKARADGLSGEHSASICLYATADAHSSIDAAAQMCGLGTSHIRRIDVDEHGRMKPDHLQQSIGADLGAGKRPVMVVATAGTTSLGAVDPLIDIARICRDENVWFHVDGAYGGLAAVSPEAPDDIHGLREADSVTIDPHKWMYMPADVGCVLTRDPGLLYDTFREGAPYYAENDEQRLLGGPERLQFRDLGPQTTRAFRALKVRLGLQLVGRSGYRQMITDDILLARALYERVDGHAELDALTLHLSIATFRFRPAGMASGTKDAEARLEKLNRHILHELHADGIAYPSHTTIAGKFALRVCIVNFNTTLADIEELVRHVVRIGRAAVLSGA
ncbi:aminotransferase class V-fold PLP-dependent enzyme [Burkholderia stagnalis]|uniref:pyridoxal phosphate-dependent decarboxylase family protein n=1 Tax=Burkholderia stagnalis TaxID=1503054 RepID=UPI002AB43835|nr:aminotransferase class V-fold PLP-dependent enzyme [Burkholderia stagnalis]MDY7806872.1 aminotransferase class V-fold PLP-dependent enzyme [Burkholderia stagnalis]